MVRSRQPESGIDPGKTEDAGKKENKVPDPEAGQGGWEKQNTLIRRKTRGPNTYTSRTQRQNFPRAVGKSSNLSSKAR